MGDTAQTGTKFQPDLSSGPSSAKYVVYMKHGKCYYPPVGVVQNGLTITYTQKKLNIAPLNCSGKFD